MKWFHVLLVFLVFLLVVYLIRQKREPAACGKDCFKSLLGDHMCRDLAGGDDTCIHCDRNQGICVVPYSIQ